MSDENYFKYTWPYALLGLLIIIGGIIGGYFVNNILFILIIFGFLVLLVFSTPAPGELYRTIIKKK